MSRIDEPDRAAAAAGHVDMQVGVVPQRMPHDRSRADRAYYQELHDTNRDYQQKNWLVEELPVLSRLRANSIMEVGCGNGLFLARAAAVWADVTGLDWARSHVLDAVLREHPAIRFIQHDVTGIRPDRRFDVVASADLLEHLPPAALPDVIRRLHEAADMNYHKIACYDDGHSHLSIMRPKQWLRVFESACPGAGYRILKTSYRGRARRKAVVVITNMSRT